MKNLSTQNKSKQQFILVLKILNENGLYHKGLIGMSL